MDVRQAIELVAGLADGEARLHRARDLAAEVGAEDILVFLRDTEAGAHMPAPGWRKTLPGGTDWREFLARAGSDGVHRGTLPWVGGFAHAVGCAARGLLIVFIGGQISDADARLVCSMAPLLRAAIAAQQSLASTAGELEAARSEIRQAAALMRSLDETRVELDRSLIELDWQARSLEQARFRAERATRAKDEFMAMLGHELRNPLAPMKTALSILRMRGMWSQEHDVMQRQVNHMIRLVEDLLDVSRIAGGKLTLDRVPAQLSTIIARAVETAAPLIDQRRQVLEVNVPAEGLCVFGDIARLAQVFANLLTNASKYSDIESRITIDAKCVGDRIQASVRDEGIGIERGMLEDVFALFHQQGRGLDRSQGGLGLGLAIVRNLVVLHEGTVEAHSDGPGLGSTFVVELPACEDGLDGLRRGGHEGGSDAGSPSQVWRILLVDDHADGRETLALAFNALGHKVVAAPDAFEALKIAEVFDPQVAVLDIGLPVMDGYELADLLRQRRAGSELTLVAVTGYGQQEDKERARTAGFNAHFVKPVDIQALVHCIEKLRGTPAALQATGTSQR